MAALDDLTTLVATLKLSFLAFVSNVVVHFVLDKLDSTLEQAVDQSVCACFIEVLLQVFADDFGAGIVVWALHGCVLTLRDMPLQVASSHCLVALLVMASYR